MAFNRQQLAHARCEYHLLRLARLDQAIMNARSTELKRTAASVGI